MEYTCRFTLASEQLCGFTNTLGMAEKDEQRLSQSKNVVNQSPLVAAGTFGHFLEAFYKTYVST